MSNEVIDNWRVPVAVHAEYCPDCWAWLLVSKEEDWCSVCHMAPCKNCKEEHMLKCQASQP